MPASSSTVPSELGGVLQLLWYCYYFHLPDETSGRSPQEYPIPSPPQRRNHKVTPYGPVSPPVSRSPRTCPQSCCSICHLEKSSVMVIHVSKTCGYLVAIVWARMLGHGCPEKIDDEGSGIDLHPLWTTVIDEYYSAFGEI